MENACFAKYDKHISIDVAIKKINTLKGNGSIPIKYDIFAEVKCEHTTLQSILKKGTITEIYDVSSLGIHSIQSPKGIWQCIAFNSPVYTLIVYTGGSSEVLYYSIL